MFLVKSGVTWETPGFCRKSPKVLILGARSRNLARSARVPTHNIVSDRVAAFVSGGITTFLGLARWAARAKVASKWANLVKNTNF